MIDSGQPCNRQTSHSHNFLTQDGKTPAEISLIAKQQVEKYETVTFYDGLAVSGQKTTDGFSISTQVNDAFHGKKLIFAAGIKDEIPAIPGFMDCWGISVIHCPYCHGSEHRNKKTGIFADGEKAFHLASLVSNLTPHLTLFTNGSSNFSPEQKNRLKKNNIQINESKLVAIEHRKGYLQQVVFENGAKMRLEAMYASIPFQQQTAIPESLGCSLTEQGFLSVDPFQQTTVEGVYACGDNSSRMRSVANSVAAGNVAGAMVNMELTKEMF
ncbi:NAD(P)/FAD-dependent oxidoreductase [Sunxiuqinia elliptica]